MSEDCSRKREEAEMTDVEDVEDKERIRGSFISIIRTDKHMKWCSRQRTCTHLILDISECRESRPVKGKTTSLVLKRSLDNEHGGGSGKFSGVCEVWNWTVTTVISMMKSMKFV